MKQKILILFALFSFVTIAKAQDTEFWFVAPDLSEQSNASCGHLDSPMMLAISNTTEREGQATITLYNNGSPIVTTNTISANGLWVYTISNAEKERVQNPRSLAGTVTKYGIHIESTVPITVYYQTLAPCNQDIFALKGSAALGTYFYVPMIHDSYYYTAPGYNPIPYDQIDIVATEESTTVTVVPTKAIRIGATSSSPAGTTITRTLSKGETLKIMEHVAGTTVGSASLGGTKITSDKPIAVTTTEDLLDTKSGADVIGDQIVPIDQLGKAYVVNKGYLVGSDRAYMTATVDGTIITVNNGSSITSSSTLNAGDNWVYNLGNGGNTNTAPQVVSVTANNPIYCYHVSGVRATGDELGSGLLPSIYSIGQTQLSLYQYAAFTSDTHHAFVVFRTGAHDKFAIRQGTGAYSTFSVTPITIPGNTDWQAAKITLPTSGQNKIITIKNSGSPFSLGYFQASYASGGASYGYLSAFGDFKFPHDTIYKCPDTSTTLEGGYASSYTWKYSPTSYDGPYTTMSETTSSITVSNEGFYTLLMDQDPKIVSDTVFVRNLDFQIAILQNTVVGSGKTTFSPSINPDLASDSDLKITYSWEFEGGVPTASTDENPLVTWTDKKLTAKLTITGETNSANSIGSCTDETVYLYLLSEIDVCMMKTDIIIDGGFALPTGTSSYQWQSSKDNTLWEDITGETGSSFSIPTLSQKRGITYYRVLLSDGTNPAVPTESSRVKFRSCRLPVNHNISVMGYYD